MLACSQSFSFSQDVIIIQLRRNLEDVMDYLSSDKSRADLGEENLRIWERRKSLYEKAADHEFFIHKGEQNWDKTEQELVAFVKRIREGSNSSLAQILGFGATNNANDTESYFLSLTCKRMEEVVPFADELFSDVNLIELRIDLMESQNEEFLREQITLLRRRSNKPLLFTLRTKDQGGQYVETNKDDDIKQLFTLALRLGVEFIDLEVTLKPDIISHVLATRDALGGATKVIASYHQFSKPVESEEEIVSIMQRCYALGSADPRPSASAIDVIKVVTFAFEERDVWTLRNGVKRAQETVPQLQHFPTIALAAGEKGKISRVLNRFLTPVTHPLLSTKAAPGTVPRLRTFVCMT